MPHGIEVEFYENGRLKSFKDLVGGKLHGQVIAWDEQGQERSREIYKQGNRVSN